MELRLCLTAVAEEIRTFRPPLNICRLSSATRRVCPESIKDHFGSILCFFNVVGIRPSCGSACCMKKTKFCCVKFGNNKFWTDECKPFLYGYSQYVIIIHEAD